MIKALFSLLALLSFSAYGDAWVECGALNTPCITHFDPVHDLPLAVNWQAEEPTRFYKSVDNIVHLEGRMCRLRSGVCPNMLVSEVAAVLPPGYRPQNQQIFPIAADYNNLLGYAIVTPDGSVYIYAQSGFWVSIANISFKAYQ
jgi:hypothetical protein